MTSIFEAAIAYNNRISRSSHQNVLIEPPSKKHKQPSWIVIYTPSAPLQLFKAARKEIEMPQPQATLSDWKSLKKALRTIRDQYVVSQNGPISFKCKCKASWKALTFRKTEEEHITALYKQIRHVIKLQIQTLELPKEVMDEQCMPADLVYVDQTPDELYHNLILKVEDTENLDNTPKSLTEVYEKISLEDLNELKKSLKTAHYQFKIEQPLKRFRPIKGFKLLKTGRTKRDLFLESYQSKLSEVNQLIKLKEVEAAKKRKRVPRRSEVLSDSSPWKTIRGLDDPDLEGIGVTQGKVAALTRLFERRATNAAKTPVLYLGSRIESPSSPDHSDQVEQDEQQRIQMLRAKRDAHENTPKIKPKTVPVKNLFNE